MLINDEPLVRFAFLNDALKMNGSRCFFAMLWIRWAVRKVIVRPSTTHGPAINTILLLPPIWIFFMRTTFISDIKGKEQYFSGSKYEKEGKLSKRKTSTELKECLSIIVPLITSSSEILHLVYI